MSEIGVGAALTWSRRMPEEPPFYAELLTGFPVVVVQDVAWGDMDSYRHVNNVVYFRYFENARLELFRRLGWFEVEEATGIGPILAATQARFRRALTYPDTIAIGTRVVSVAKDRFTIEHHIVSRKVPLPEELRARLLALGGGPAIS